MARIQGYQGSVSVDGNVVAQVREFDVNLSVERLDGSRLGVAYEEADPGQTTGEWSVRCWLDPSDATGQGALVEGATVALLLHAAGVGSGLPQLSFTGVVASIAQANARSSNVTHEINGWVNSAVDRSPQA